MTLTDAPDQHTFNPGWHLAQLKNEYPGVPGALYTDLWDTTRCRIALFLGYNGFDDPEKLDQIQAATFDYIRTDGMNDQYAPDPTEVVELWIDRFTRARFLRIVSRLWAHHSECGEVARTYIVDLPDEWEE